ncbi:proteasome inhibitor PI31 subunit-like [Ptychodera flava]|uniref:proteasome inhibitor PI31 subunit-like n=1 Tax=Ptychodera flava TaxID=63121 RepID=UPI003969FB9E
MAGLELLYASVSNQISSGNDSIVCYLHWCMIHNGFRCIGSGEEAPKGETRPKKSELLPCGWNSSQDCYTLRYQPNDGDETYLFKAIPLEETLLVHVMRMSDETVATLNVEVDRYTNTQQLGNFESAYQNLEELHDNFKKEIIDDLKNDEKKTKGEASSLRDERLPSNTQQERRSRRDEDDDPLRVGPPRRPYASRQPEWGEPSNPLDIGRGDLDPFHAGGGMLMDPMRSGFPRGGIPDPSAGLPGRLPRGAVPPGARFDPFGPPGTGPDSAFRSGPDPDHLPPPGYDDMFG